MVGFEVFSRAEDNKGVCGLKTEVAADIVALIEIVATVIASFDLHGLVYLLTIVEVLTYAGVFVAHYKQSPNWYLPYFVNVGINLSFAVVGEMVLIVCAILMPEWWMDKLVRGGPRQEQDLRLTLQLLTAVAAGALLLMIGVSCYLFKIVVDAFRCMRLRQIA